MEDQKLSRYYLGVDRYKKMGTHGYNSTIELDGTICIFDRDKRDFCKIEPKELFAIVKKHIKEKNKCAPPTSL